MIVVCEPQIRGFGHEKVNSGFLLGLRLAFPEQKIVVYAHKTHISALKSIILYDNIVINDIVYKPIKFNTSNSLLSYISYLILFYKLLNILKKQGINKLFLLSSSDKIISVLKRLKLHSNFSSFKFTLVLHGAYEEIAVKTMAEEIESFSKLKLAVFILTRFWRVFYLFDKLFYFKKSILKQPTKDFKYIFLSEHIRTNSKKYIDLEQMDHYVIPLPTVFKDLQQVRNTDYVKFAIFGRGDYEMLNKIASLLKDKQIESKYEIRIIGKDYQGLENFPNITCSSPGIKLLRSEMERQVRDIDMFLIVYEPSKYQLSCSGSVFETLSYAKPIIHFQSDCLKNYNTPEYPIGIACKSIDEFANTLTYYINNYKSLVSTIDMYRNNILEIRKKYTIENSVEEIRKSFTW